MALAPSAPATFGGNNGRIAFASDRDGNFEIYLKNVDWTHQHRLTHRRSLDDDPTFFPNGKKIAFGRWEDAAAGSS